MSQQINLNVNVSIDQTTPINCSCGNNTFQDGFMLRKVSRILTGQDQDSLVPVQVFICTKCGEPVQEFIPSLVKSILEREKISKSEVLEVIEENPKPKGKGKGKLYNI